MSLQSEKKSYRSVAELVPGLVVGLGSAAAAEGPEMPYAAASWGLVAEAAAELDIAQAEERHIVRTAAGFVVEEAAVVVAAEVVVVERQYADTGEVAGVVGVVDS
jgi:hypothetical protein